MGFIPGSQGWFNMCKSIIIYRINKRKVKNLIVISIDAEKTFDTVHHPFMIKILTKVDIEGTILSVIDFVIFFFYDNLEVFCSVFKKFLGNSSTYICIFNVLINPLAGSCII